MSSPFMATREWLKWMLDMMKAIFLYPTHVRSSLLVNMLGWEKRKWQLMNVVQRINVSGGVTSVSLHRRSVGWWTGKWILMDYACFFFFTNKNKRWKNNFFSPILHIIQRLALKWILISLLLCIFFNLMQYVYIALNREREKEREKCVSNKVQIKTKNINTYQHRHFLLNNILNINVFHSSLLYYFYASN